MEKIKKVLEHLAESYGLFFIWKQVGSQGDSCGFDEEHTLHLNSFCMRVKAEPERLHACIRNDNQLLVEKAERVGGIFVHRCHAGVSELVVPFFKNGHCGEVLILGIFRTGRERCHIPGLKKEFRKLPLLTAKKLKRLMSLLADLAEILRERRITLDLADLARRIRDERIVAAVHMIDNKFCEPLKIESLAQTSCLSKSRFIYLFKQETGVNFREYLKKRRLKEAEKLLMNTSGPVVEIMERCGFHDQSRFSKFFREETGYTPLAFRKLFAHEGNA
ncbi:MAG: helix-turn-helix domain-containing protein [Victivallaceae bacterium]